MTGLRAPLSIRVNDGITDRLVSRSSTGLRFRKTAPGGYTEMSVKVNLPRSTFTDLGSGDKIWVYSPTGAVLFEGFVDNPGESDGDDGQSFDLTCLGTTVLAQDHSQPLVYVDTDLTPWVQAISAGTSPSATASATDDPSATNPALAAQGLLCQFNPGQPIASGTVAQIGYPALTAAGMTFGAIAFTVTGGSIDAGYRADLQWAAGTGTFTGTVLTGTTITTTPTAVSLVVAGSGAPPAGQDRIALEIRRAGGATNVATDTVWLFFSNLSILGRRVDINGTLLTGAQMGSASSVLASDVVTDLLGRMMPVDPLTSSVDTTTFAIDQLAYPDGATAGDVLDDLADYEPTLLWEVLESSGRGYRVNYRAWPTTARYELSTADGFTAPGGDNDLCNRQIVYWTNSRGVKQTTIITATSATYPALSSLEDAGRVKDADPITLDDGRGSLAVATAIGTAALAAAANPPVSATATVRRQIIDLQTGSRVAPWAIEPGCLARVRETGDLLRVTEMEYDDDQGEAVLTLGQPRLTTEQRVARLRKRRSA